LADGLHSGPSSLYDTIAGRPEPGPEFTQTPGD